jgi:F-type H+-transporting ATPase subunit delta
MPFLTETNATTRVYAASLIDLVLKASGREGVESVVSELREIVDLTKREPRFAELLSHPTISREARSKSIDTIFKGRVSDMAFKFLHVLNDKGRINALPGVVASVDEQVQKQFGRVEVDVYTAQPTTDTEGLRSRLSAAMGKDVVVHPHTDPKMIGGIKLKIGDQLIDASIATRLRRMKDKLAKEGGEAMRARIGRVLGV